MKNIILITLVCLLFNCKEDEDFVPPSVLTEHNQVLLDGGAIIYGDFQNFNTESVLGFEVYNDFGSFQNIEIINPIVGENSVTITTGLNIDQEYKYKAYIRTTSEIYYGLEESFISNGSVAASFSSITPNQGDFNDIIEIESNMELSDAYINDIIVLFNEEEATNISINGNTIRCEVPYYDGNPTSEIQVNYFGNVIQTSLNYELLPPIIESISPNEVTFRDEVVITGNHFEDINSEYLMVMIDGIEAVVLNKSKTSLTVRVPDDVISTTPSIKIISNLQEIELQNAITMKSPVITSYSMSGNIFDTIDIFVENINPVYYNNAVYFGDVKAITFQPSDGSTNRIAAQIPQGPYTDWETTIRVKTSNEIESSSYPFTILDSTIEILDNVDIPISDYQVYNNIIYVYGFGISNPNQLMIHKYSVIDNEFYDSQSINMPVVDSFKIISTNDGYIYLYYNRDQNNFFRINLNTYQLESLQDFPGDKRRLPIVSFDDENITIGNGLDPTNTEYPDIFKYSRSTDSWTQINNVPYLPVFRSFYSKNESYFLQGVYSVASDVYKFNGNDEYVLVSNSFPNAFKDYYGIPYVFKNNKFYFIEESSPTSNPMMVFDITNYSWSEVFNVLPNDGYSITGIFTKGDYIYIQILDSQQNYHLLKLDLNRV